jgi:hypothetical protein
MYRTASFLKSGFIETKYRVPVIRTFMASQALVIPGRTETEICGAITLTRKVTGIGLNLLTQSATCRLMAVLTLKVFMTTVHRATRMQTLLIR